MCAEGEVTTEFSQVAGRSQSFLFVVGLNSVRRRPSGCAGGKNAVSLLAHGAQAFLECGGILHT